jgi:hypothetical protein
VKVVRSLNVPAGTFRVVSMTRLPASSRYVSLDSPNGFSSREIVAPVDRGISQHYSNAALPREARIDRTHGPEDILVDWSIPDRSGQGRVLPDLLQLLFVNEPPFTKRSAVSAEEARGAAAKRVRDVAGVRERRVLAAGGTVIPLDRACESPPDIVVQSPHKAIQNLHWGAPPRPIVELCPEIGVDLRTPAIAQPGLHAVRIHARPSPDECSDEAQ